MSGYLSSAQCLNHHSKADNPCERTREGILADSRHRIPHTKHITQRITHHHGHSHGLGIEIPAHVKHRHENHINQSSTFETDWKNLRCYYQKLTKILINDEDGSEIRRVIMPPIYLNPP
jgi:hypothetical protein